MNKIQTVSVTMFEWDENYVIRFTRKNGAHSYRMNTRRECIDMLEEVLHRWHVEDLRCCELFSNISGIPDTQFAFHTHTTEIETACPDEHHTQAFHPNINEQCRPYVQVCPNTLCSS